MFAREARAANTPTPAFQPRFLALAGRDMERAPLETETRGFQRANGRNVSLGVFHPSDVKICWRDFVVCGLKLVVSSLRGQYSF